MARSPYSSCCFAGFLAQPQIFTTLSKKETGLAWAWTDCKKADRLDLPRLTAGNGLKLQVLSHVQFFQQTQIDISIYIYRYLYR